MFHGAPLKPGTRWSREVRQGEGEEEDRVLGIKLPRCQAHRQGMGGLCGLRKLGGGRGLRSLSGGEGKGGAFWRVSLSSVLPASPPSNLLPDIPWKKPFAVEVNGPAQINSSVWVSLDVNKAPESPLGALIGGSRTPPHVTQQPPSTLISLFFCSSLTLSEPKSRLSGKTSAREKVPFTWHAAGGLVRRAPSFALNDLPSGLISGKHAATSSENQFPKLGPQPTSISPQRSVLTPSSQGLPRPP